MVYDDIDRHIEKAGTIERAATPIGMYLAWSVNLSLVSAELLAAAGRDALRLQVREITGAELLIKVCRGRLESSHFSQIGQHFTASHYAEYLADYARIFGVAADAIYAVENTWDHYDRIAPVLTRRHLGEPPSRGDADRGDADRGHGRWWRWATQLRNKMH